MANEATPLLKRFSNGVPLRSVLICALTYVLALLFVITPLSKIFTGEGSRHLVATTTVWFHPIRPRGNLIEVMMYTGQLLLLAIFMCFGALALLRLELAHSLEILALTLWLGATLGFIGFLKMRAQNPSFNTASSAAIIFVVSVLLKQRNLDGNAPLVTMEHYLQMVITGAVISTVVSFTCYGETSLAFLRKATAELEADHTRLAAQLVRAFGRDPPPETTAEKLAADQALAEVMKQAEFARYERMFARDQAAYSQALRSVRRLERENILIGGMFHCLATMRGIQFGTGSRSPNEPASITSTSTAKFESLRPALIRLADVLHSHAGSKSTTSAVQEAMRDYITTRDRFFADPHAEIDGDEVIPAEQAASACVLLAHHLQNFAQAVCPELEAPHIYTPQLAPPLPAAARAAAALQPTPEPMPPQTARLEHAMYAKRASSSGLGPRVWRFFRFLRSRNVLHGIRVGVGAVIIAFPAYLDSTRPLYHSWHMEWSVITYMIIMNRNLAAMSHNIPLRFIGTTLGALCGIVSSVFINPLLLLLFSAVLCFFCYRRILSKQDPVLGRFVLLTYNLVSLYQYSNAESNIFRIAFHRVASVTVGVLWAVFITTTVWPYSARQELRSKLCIQWMRMGMAWKRDLLAVDSNGDYHVRFDERELQNTMFKLEDLLKICPNEIRLRGTFDAAQYKRLLESTQTMLDAFNSLAVFIRDLPHATPGELELLRKTELARLELCHVLFLQFYTASTSVRLGFPVPEFVPSPDLALRKFAKSLSKAALESADYVMFYTYATVVMSLSTELKGIHESLGILFGALDDDVLFVYV